jgi:hypothetical protein
LGAQDAGRRRQQAGRYQDQAEDNQEYLLGLCNALYLAVVHEDSNRWRADGPGTNPAAWPG